MSKSDAINLGDGADTVTLNATAALTTADNAVAKVLTINGFSGDKILFKGTGGSAFDNFADLLSSEFDSDVLNDSTGSAVTLTKSKLTQDKAVADRDSDVAALITGAAKGFANLDASSEYLLVTNSTTTGVKNIWYLNGGTSGDASDDVIVLLASVNTAGVDFVEANFTA